MVFDHGRSACVFVRVLARAFLRACLPAVIGALPCLQAAAGAALTETEQRWLAAGKPVLSYARQAGLPLDIIVQPTVHPEISPLSMAWIDGRCKLVLTMRGNPMVERHLADVPEALQDIVIEAMTAHEMGHCWRHHRGDWRAAPAGFARPAAGRASAGDREGQRREEGFADLVGLAWTRSRHPGVYGQVHAWLLEQRDTGGAPGAAHDTDAWLALARDPAAFAGQGTLFEQAIGLWEAGLRAEE